jgi:hypothetical protein
MTSNFATWGGAAVAEIDANIVAANCMMTSNAALNGGAVSAADDSHVTVRDSTVSLNRAAVQVTSNNLV